MKKIKLVLLAALMVVSSLLVNGQIVDKTKPISFNKAAFLKHKVQIYSLPKFDVNKLIAEDKANENKAKPYRFAKTFNIYITPWIAGTWDTLPNGDKIWRITFRSNGAYSLHFLINPFYLPDGAKLYFYNKDKSYVLGAITSLNNKKSGHLPINLIPGDEVTAELYVPFYVNPKDIKLTFTKVYHAYKNVVGWIIGTKDSQFGASGSCNVDVVCPENAGWENETNSVVRIVLGGGLCSGALLNNTAQDGTPYILTANHCIGEPYANWIFNFKYQVDQCGSTTDPYPNFNDIPSISGSELRATAGDGESGNQDTLDFCLVEMSQMPPASYNPYYAGWDHSGNTPNSARGIHHPSGDVKKFCIENDPLTVGSYPGYDANTHWHIAQWDLGVTEPGSSGSPLFDNETHRVIGDLTGGQADCSNPINDYYEMFSHSWADYPAPQTQLKHWLDPTNSGVEYIDGYDPYNSSGLTANFTASPTTVPVGATVTFTDQSTPVDSIVSWQWDFGGTAASPSTSTSQGPINVTYNAPGTYTVTLIVSNGTDYDTLVRPDYITVTDTTNTNNLDADFTASATTIFVGQTVNFTDASSGNPTSWSWTFQGGTPSTSTDQNPTGITYNTVGDYTVSLTISDGTNSDTETKNEYIHVVDSNALIVDFNASQTTILQGSSIDFNAYTVANGPATSWQWTFYGATPNTSTEQNPTGITYNTVGTFSVKLVASDGTYTDEVVKDNYITVVDPNTAVVADFVADYTNITPGTSINFTNLTTGLVDSVRWYFYGATPNTSSDNDPSGITYSALGQYDVMLIAYGPLGTDTAYKENYIHVIDPGDMGEVNVDFHAITPRLIVQGGSVSYEDLSTGNPINFDWTFEGGNPATSTIQNPQGIIYSIPGIYDVTLAASNSISSDTLTKTSYVVVTSQVWPDPHGYCDTITNVAYNEIPYSYRHLTQTWGYIPGHNGFYTSAYADKFLNYMFDNVRAIIIPVAKAYANSNNAKVRFSVWDVDNNGRPGNLLGYKDVDMSSFNPNMYTAIEFDDRIEVNSKFFVGYQLFYNSPQDTFVTYMGPNRGIGGNNTMYIEQAGSWKTPSELLLDTLNTSLVIKVVGCVINTEEIDLDKYINIYPNPVKDILYFDFGEIYAKDAKITLMDATGRALNVKTVKDINKAYIDMTNLSNGVYLVQINLQGKKVIKKVTLVK